MGKWPFESLQFREMPAEKMQIAAREFFEEIRKRRTVRDFSDRPVPREIIEYAIRAAGVLRPAAPICSPGTSWRCLMRN